MTLLRQNSAYYVRAYVINNTADTAYGNEVSFSTLKDSTNPLQSFTYSLYTWRYGASIPGLMNQAYENQPVYSYVGKMTLHFDSDVSYTQKQYDSSGNLSNGTVGSYSIGSYFPDSLFYAETGSDSSNSYGHHYPEGWGLKIPPGIKINFFNSVGTPFALPSRMSVDNQFIYMMQSGDMVWRRDD